MSPPKTSKERGILLQQSSHATTHPLSPTLRNVFWPEFPTLQDEFSTIVSELLDVLNGLQPTQFDKLLVYLRERLKPVANGCFPTGEPADLPNGPITPLDLIQLLQIRWDYLNTDLLEDIIRRVTKAGSHLQSLMAKYKANVCSKVARTLKECKKKSVKPEPPPNYTIMAAEVNPGVNPLSFHLYQILQLKDLLITKFGVRSALFAGFHKGSIVLYFFIPDEAVYSLCTKLESECVALEELHVTSVVVFDHFSVDVSFQQMTILRKVGVALYLDNQIVCWHSLYLFRDGADCLAFLVNLCLSQLSNLGNHKSVCFIFLYHTINNLLFFKVS